MSSRKAGYFQTVSPDRALAQDGIAHDFNNLLVRIAALGVSWEHTFLDGEDLTTITIGARVAFDLDL